MPLDVTYPHDVDPALAPLAGALAFGRQRLKQSLEGLSSEQLMVVPSGFANSVATLVVHLSATEVRFGHLLMGETPADDLRAAFLLDAPYSPLPVVTGETADSLTGKLDASRTIFLRALGRLQPTDLDRVVDIGRGREATVRWILSLVTNHQTQHMGHIQMLRKFL